MYKKDYRPIFIELQVPTPPNPITTQDLRTTLQKLQIHVINGLHRNDVLIARLFYF